MKICKDCINFIPKTDILFSKSLCSKKYISPIDGETIVTYNGTSIRESENIPAFTARESEIFCGKDSRYFEDKKDA